MLTLRDIVTAIIGGFLAASVAYAAEGALGTTTHATTHHAPIHQHAPAKTVSCQLPPEESALPS